MFEGGVEVAPGRTRAVSLPARGMVVLLLSQIRSTDDTDISDRIGDGGVDVEGGMARLQQPGTGRPTGPTPTAGPTMVVSQGTGGEGTSGRGAGEMARHAHLDSRAHCGNIGDCLGLKLLRPRVMLRPTMATDAEGFSALLVQLDRIAKAPMTSQERELRAKSLLGASVDVGKLAGSTASAELGWNVAKASEHGAPVVLWLRAVGAAGIPTSTSVAELLDRIHRADAIADMLKAGYAAGIDPLGHHTWRARG